MQLSLTALSTPVLALTLVGVIGIYLKLHRRLGKVDRLIGDLKREMVRLGKEAQTSERKQLERDEKLEKALERSRKAIERSHEVTREVLKDDQVQAGYANSIATLYPSFPVFLGGPALDGFSARILFERIEQDRPKTILELGSGASTIMIAALLQKLSLSQTRLISVDDSEYYLEATRRNFERHGFGTKVDFWHCPMSESHRDEPGWYSGVLERLGDTKLDLVLVDGPSGSFHARSREPALPRLFSHLSEHATVILDDAARAGEQAIMESWKKAFPQMDVRFHRRGKGCAEFRMTSRA